jgi:RNA polymerase-binding transcription factor DksA
LRDLLVFRLSDLEAQLRGDRSALADEGATPAGEVSDRKDAASQHQMSDVDDAQFQRDLAETEAVKAALQRLDSGKYGDCVACGEPIALQRLLVQPAALRCAHCQTALEHAQPGRHDGAAYHAS